MLELEKLRFKGIGRFAEMQEICFDKLGRLVQLDGDNRNTKGSSGAGKSTVFMALDYLLGMNHRPSTVLKCRYTEDGIFVEGIFKNNGRPLTITRGKKLSIDNDGTLSSGSSSIAEEKLDEILGMERELFRKILHKRQKEGGFFLEMAPAAVDSFLTDALGYDKIKKSIIIVDKKDKELKERRTNNVSSLTSARAGLKATQDAILSLGLAPIKDIHQSVVLELKKKYDQSASDWATVSSRHAVELQTLDLSRPKIESSLFDRSQIEALESRLFDLRTEQERFTKRENARLSEARSNHAELERHILRLKEIIRIGKAAAEKIKEISDQIKAIKAGKCFNCGQDWQDALKEKKLQQEALVRRAELLDGKQAEESVPLAEGRLPGLTEAIKPIENPDKDRIAEETVKINEQLTDLRAAEKNHNAAHTAALKQAQAEFSAKQTELRTRHAQEADQSRGQADVDRRAFEAAVSKLKAYEDARTRYENSLASLKSQEESYQKKVDELSEASKTIDADYAKNDELLRALKSYLSCSFDEALETISENATRLIRNIPNMCNATIQLKGLKENKDGKVKEEVNATIHMDGEENIDIRSLCGGERTALDLAIDLSVIDLLENKANKGINIFILDEPFEGLDTVCIEMALEVLKNSNSNKRLVIVDHNPEVKEMVESKIVAVREGLISRIEQS